ncbi:hypothetical protein RHA1_ro11118 (plasmid) [Rhodococcus jostii RHA1]|uniref:Uncharacterized protein n=1 Tax=Rhodococcus jostii (strain RHA1) TaxID=101510 RepID=Q0RVC1_RHOJR|nr:hypothetical protein RHA1_ro11118 [Rhodococcus jostii RHA1]
MRHVVRNTGSSDSPMYGPFLEGSKYCLPSPQPLLTSAGPGQRSSQHGTARPASRCRLKKCQGIETDCGGHTLRPMIIPQVAASRNVIGSETLQFESGDAAGGPVAAGGGYRTNRITRCRPVAAGDAPSDGDLAVHDLLDRGTRHASVVRHKFVL